MKEAEKGKLRITINSPGKSRAIELEGTLEAIQSNSFILQRRKLRPSICPKFHRQVQYRQDLNPFL